MSTIAAAIMARDAAAILPDLFKSLDGHVDEIVVGVDNRTVDQTREVAATHGATVIDVDLIRDGVMDFAQGRNQITPHIKSEWMLWIDSDDVLAGPPEGNGPPAVNLHQIIDEARPGTESIWLPYLYSRDEHGKLVIEHYRERLLKMSAHPHWIARLHENCRTDSGPKAIGVEGKDERGHPHRPNARVMIEHRNRKQTEEGKWDRNHPILMKMIEEDPHDLTTIREIAEAHYAATDWVSAIEWYDKYVKESYGDAGTAIEERWMAVVYLSRALRMAKRYRESLQTADRALLMCPQYADSYFELAYGYLGEGHWSKAIWWFEQGEGKAEPGGILQTAPRDYQYLPYVMIHQAYAQLHQWEKAAACVERALAYQGDPDLQVTLQGYRHLANRKTIVQSAIDLASFLVATNESEKALRVFEALPVGSGEDFPDAVEARDLVSQATAHLRSQDVLRMAEMSRPPREYRARPWLSQRLQGTTRVLAAGTDAMALGEATRVVAIDRSPIVSGLGNAKAVEAGYMTLIDAPDYTPNHPHIHNGDCFTAEEGQDATLQCTIPEHPHVSWTADCEQCGPVLRLPDMNPAAQVQYWVADPERIPPAVESLGPYDAVVLDDVLGRTIDPRKTLDEAERISKRVLLTVPDGTAPRPTDPSEVRAWSRQEIELLCWGRGRVVESHFLAGDANQIGVEYIAGETTMDRLPVTIFCGGGLEQWTPDQVNTQGLGGSETAVVHLAKELVRKGYRVMVYAEAEGIWEGVYYRHHSKFVPSNPVHMFISWRRPNIFDEQIQAEFKYLWVHDLHYGADLNEERFAKMDGILTVSSFHSRFLKSKYPFLDESKMTPIGNGIDPTRFTGDVSRDVSRFVYVSSPDRGLDKVLVYWPKIKEAIPEAELHIFYGWENYDRMGADRAFKDFIIEKSKQPGVTWHGRIGQQELAQELMRSSALLYPGPHNFEETFCIAVLEAQAAGCVPVTRDNGALPETNRHGFLLNNVSATVNDYIASLKDASQQTQANAKWRREMADWAKTQTWERVAERLIAVVPVPQTV